MRTAFRVLLTAVVVLNLAVGGAVPAMACHTAKPAIKEGCCCCGGQTMQKNGCAAEDSLNIVPATGCGCNLKGGDGQATSEFTLNNTSDKLQFTTMPAGNTTAAHIQNSLVGAKSVKEFCAFESPPLYKLTSSYLC